MRSMRSVLAATDLTPASDRVLRVAAELAARCEAELHVLHALHLLGRPLREVLVPLERGDVGHAARRLVEQVARVVPAEARLASREVGFDAPARAAADRAREVGADLVVIGAPELDPIGEEVARRAGLPVLVVATDGEGVVFVPPYTQPSEVGMMEEMRALLERTMAEKMEELTVSIPAALGEQRAEAEYQALTRRQRELNREIQRLGLLVSGLVLVDPRTIHPERIGFGSHVTVKDLRTGEEDSYTLLAGDLLDVIAGQVSVDSPVGAALVGSRVGDEVTVSTPGGSRRLRVVAATTLPAQLAEGADAGPVLSPA